MPTETDINAETISSIDNLDKNIDFLSRNFRAALRRYTREVDKLVSSSQIDVTRLIDIVQLGETLRTLLTEAGIDEFFDEYLRSFADVERKALKYFELFDIPPNLVGLDVSALNTLLRLNETTLREMMDQRLVLPIRNSILQTALATRTTSQTALEVGALIDRYNITTASGELFTDFQVETLIRDSIVRYHRQVVTEKADSVGLNIYLYSGPLDSNTRPACRTMLTINRHGVAGMLYKDEVNTSLHPALSFDPLSAGGGYNCRHRWSPVTETFAKSMGFNTDGRSNSKD